MLVNRSKIAALMVSASILALSSASAKELGNQSISEIEVLHVQALQELNAEYNEKVKAVEVQYQAMVAKRESEKDEQKKYTIEPMVSDLMQEPEDKYNSQWKEDRKEHNEEMRNKMMDMKEERKLRRKELKDEKMKERNKMRDEMQNMREGWKEQRQERKEDWMENSDDMRDRRMDMRDGMMDNHMDNRDDMHDGRMDRRDGMMDNHMNHKEDRMDNRINMQNNSEGDQGDRLGVQGKKNSNDKNKRKSKKLE